MNGWVGALSHAQLARALALSDDTEKARTSYQDFFALWKDADPDIPLLKQFHAEYAKLPIPKPPSVKSLSGSRLKPPVAIVKYRNAYILPHHSNGPDS